MPTSTFFNLPEEKKKRIIEAALNEFSRNTFDEASIASIIREAGIPRGSFYQYFGGKKDIYKYVLNLITREKKEKMDATLKQTKNLGFFKTLMILYKVGLEFFVEKPRYAQIGELFINTTKEEIKKEIYGDSINETSQFHKMLLEEGIENGEVKENINVDLTAELLVALGNATTEHLLKKGSLDAIENNMEAYKDMLDFVKYGIANDEHSR